MWKKLIIKNPANKLQWKFLGDITGHLCFENSRSGFSEQYASMSGDKTASIYDLETYINKKIDEYRKTGNDQNVSCEFSMITDHVNQAIEIFNKNTNKLILKIFNQN